MIQEIDTVELNTVPLYEWEKPWEKPVERRGFLGFMGKVGAASLVATSGVFAFAGKAAAAPPCNCNAPNFACCTLNHPNDCPLDQFLHPYCPSPNYLYVWHCCTCGSSRTYACMECEYHANGTCCVDNSETYCSAYWTTAPNACTCQGVCGCQNVLGCA
jgi:hypothetical protein